MNDDLATVRARLERGAHVVYPSQFDLDVITMLAAYDDQAARLAAVDELVEAAKSWAVRDYMIDPNKGGLERVKRTDRLVRAARTLLEADGGTWYEVSEFPTGAGTAGKDTG